MVRALEQLYALDALNSKGNLTKLGREIAFLPLSPQLGRAFIAAVDYNCLGDVIDIIACLSANSSSAAGIFKERRNTNLDDDDCDISTNAKERFSSREGDHITLLRVFREYQTVKKESNSDVSAWCKKWEINKRVMRSAEV